MHTLLRRLVVAGSLFGPLACTPTDGKPAEPSRDSGGSVADADEYVCKSDADCVMSCVGETDCCGNPCGCDQVRHTDEHAAVLKKQVEYCSDKIEECPSVGGCDPSYEYATPTCTDGACVGVLPESRRAAEG